MSRDASGMARSLVMLIEAANDPDGSVSAPPGSHQEARRRWNAGRHGPPPDTPADEVPNGNYVRLTLLREGWVESTGEAGRLRLTPFGASILWDMREKLCDTLGLAVAPPGVWAGVRRLADQYNEHEGDRNRGK